ncbi:hypothetical protein [Candidatus Lokiarchaeum ossiferum]|uniref:hypothetical protein n=1 Tax=Candidatus Lokiarchaeum ossiferum TaxID=2951803 RepID=UPI00352C21F2
MSSQKENITIRCNIKEKYVYFTIYLLFNQIFLVYWNIYHSYDLLFFLSENQFSQSIYFILIDISCFFFYFLLLKRLKVYSKKEQWVIFLFLLVIKIPEILYVFYFGYYVLVVSIIIAIVIFGLRIYFHRNPEKIAEKENKVMGILYYLFREYLKIVVVAFLLYMVSFNLQFGLIDYAWYNPWQNLRTYFHSFIIVTLIVGIPRYLILNSRSNPLKKILVTNAFNFWVCLLVLAEIRRDVIIFVMILSTVFIIIFVIVEHAIWKSKSKVLDSE